MNLLLLISSAPAEGILKHSLDVALTSAVFGQQVSLLFVGKGVEHLYGAAASSLDELPEYGIEHLYAEQRALPNQQPRPSAVTALSDDQIGTLLALQHCVLHF